MRLRTGKIEGNKFEAERHFGPEAGLWLACKRVKNLRGFTLVEMITIIVILGIISVAAIPRFFDKNAFDSRGYYDQVISTLRFAQKTAVAQRRSVCVTFAADSITLTIDSNVPPDGCDANLTSPAGLTPFTVTAPDGVTFSAPAVGTVLSFNALGSPNATPPISINGYPTVITVEAGTGYVHQ